MTMRVTEHGRRDAPARSRGFTLVELMVVVLLISVLLLIAVPVFTQSSQRAAQRACWANQHEVESAWQVCRSAEASPAAGSWDALMTALVPDYLEREPACPSGGTYWWDGADVMCSIPEHAR